MCNCSQADFPNWKKFHRGIRQYSLYDADDPTIDGVLHDLATLPIIEAGNVTPLYHQLFYTSEFVSIYVAG